MQTLVIPSTSIATSSNLVPSSSDDLPPPSKRRDVILGIVHALIVHSSYNIPFRMRLIRFQGNTLRHTMDVSGFRRRSKGWEKDPVAYIHSRILFGPGSYITDEFLTTHNITHVINCAFEQDSPSWFKMAYPENYKCLNSPDSLDANILDWYVEFEKTIHAFLRDKNSRNIYVHCQCGINRSGFLCLAFMCKRLSIDFFTGVKTILTQRPCALTNPQYKRQVYEFSEQKL
jgi:hypothetical protein